MKKVISIILTAVLVTSAAAMPAQAKTWIKVSSWAYNDVSNFKSEGLVPEAMEDVEDYTQEITRVQFAEIIYSVLARTQSFRSNYRYDGKGFSDTSSRAVEVLNYEGIITGEINSKGKRAIHNGTFGDEGEGGYFDFFPYHLLTREEMAAILRRAANTCHIIDNSTPLKEPPDAQDISNWAKEDVYKMLGSGLLSGAEDGRFMPKNHLTIEQAVVAVYNLYKNIPSAPEADGEGLTGDDEQEVQTYSNGLTETKKGNVLYLKDGDKTLMEFETDIYSNIHCITVNGTVYAAAQKSNGKTDVYNAETKEVLFKIPHPVKGVKEDGIYTKSNNIGPTTFGLVDYSGRELLEPKYSMEELEIIRQNGFKIPKDKYQAPSGWIYYIDYRNHLYKMDSNGENKRKISDKNISSFWYLNNHIFYWDADDNLYCMDPDGGNDQFILDDSQSHYFHEVGYDELSIIDRFAGYGGYYIEHILSGRDRYADNSGRIYYIKYTEHDDDSYTQELYRISIESGKVINEKIAPELNYTTTMQVKDGKVYFLDSGTAENMKTDDLYCFDGEKVTKLAEEITNFGFCGDKLVIVRGTYYDNDENRPAYLADMDGSNEEIWQEFEAHMEKYGEYGKDGPKSDTFTDIWNDISDDEVTVYEVTSYTTNEQGERDYVYELYARDKDGRETLIVDSREMGYLPGINRVGNKLYYRVEREHAADGQLMIYDMETGESREIADNVYELTIEKCDRYSNDVRGGKSWFMYRDLDRNTWRYNTDTDMAEGIFPNANIRKYGKVEQMLGTNTGMYKVDTDGNISFIMDELAANCVYVENGASEGIKF